jgi:hypothetical protein
LTGTADISAANTTLREQDGRVLHAYAALHAAFPSTANSFTTAPLWGCKGTADAGARCYILSCILQQLAAFDRCQCHRGSRLAPCHVLL